MEIEIKKSGAKVFRYEEGFRQVDGGFEDTALVPCGTRGCENRFETTYPEPGEAVTVFCPECIREREIDSERLEMEIY